MKFKQAGFATNPSEPRKRTKRHRLAAAETTGKKVLASGEITLPPGSIPSPSGGKSSALDFSHALMQGHPIAEQAMRDAFNTVPKGAPISDVHNMIDKYAKKDEPTVADKFIASSFQWCKYFNYTAKEEKIVTPILMAYRKAMRFSHRFVLDNEFVVYATELSNRAMPEKLLARLPLATLPYETTWIEFDLPTKVRTMRRFHGLSDLPAEGVLAQRLGLLLERVNDTMSTVTLVPESPDAVTTPNLTGYVFSTDERTLTLAQTFHGMTPFDAAYRIDRLKRMPLFKDVMKDPESASIMERVAHGSMWGYGKGGVIDNQKDFAQNIGIPTFLMRHGQLAFSRFYDFFENAGKTLNPVMTDLSKMITTEVAEFTGMMRWLVIVLAMLNEVPTRAEFIQPMHQMRHGLIKRVAAFDYHRLTLRLPKTKAMPFLERHISNVERHHKAHKVRSHWRTYLHENVPCMPDDHVWEYDNENGYALCGKCMGFRRRIPDHVRGDPSLGWVHKDYVIKPTKQE